MSASAQHRRHEHRLHRMGLVVGREGLDDRSHAPVQRDGEERSLVIRGSVDVAAQAGRNHPRRRIHRGEVGGVVDRRRPRRRVGDDQVVDPLPDELAGVGQVVAAVAGVVVPQEDVDVPRQDLVAIVIGAELDLLELLARSTFAEEDAPIVLVLGREQGDPVDRPRQLDTEEVDERRQDVDRLRVGVADLARLEPGSLDEQRRVEHVGKGRLVLGAQHAPRPARREPDAVVGGHDHDAVLVEVRLPQPVEDLTDVGVGVTRLEDQALLLEGDRGRVVADVGVGVELAAGRHRPDVVVGVARGKEPVGHVGKEDVQEVQGRRLVALDGGEQIGRGLDAEHREAGETPFVLVRRALAASFVHRLVDGRAGSRDRGRGGDVFDEGGFRGDLVAPGVGHGPPSPRRVAEQVEGSGSAGPVRHPLRAPPRCPTTTIRRGGSPRGRRHRGSRDRSG